VRGSIRTRLLVSFLLVAITAAAGLSVYFLGQIEAFGMRRLEERLTSEAGVAAAAIGAAVDLSGATTLSGGGAGYGVSGALADATSHSTSRMLVIDAGGKVIADSARKALGDNYRARPPVARALKGDVGMATGTGSDGRISLTVAAPVRVGGRVVGATFVTGSTLSIATLLADYRDQLLIGVAAFLAAALVLTELLSRWLTRPLHELQAGAAALATDASVRVRPAGPRETRELAEAFNELAEEIETSSMELHEEERRKSRFISDVSHELRSPLTGIRLAAETLLDGDVGAENHDRFLATIIRESDRLTGLANDLLELQRIEGATGELPIGRVDLTQTARLAVEANEPVAAERGVAVKVSGSAPDVLGARDRLQQVVGNLVDNATRHTPAGRSVSVELSEEDGRAVLRVADEGPGIPERDLANLFERFYRAQYSRDRATGGTGLGLSIVRAIVTSHHGTIEAANRPEGGAVFTVRLPKLDA
jgi:two-component system OmpR family sensor kinase